MSPGAFDARKDEWRSYKGSAHFICPDCDRTSPCEVKVGTTVVRCGRCKTEFGEAEWLSSPPFPAPVPPAGGGKDEKFVTLMRRVWEKCVDTQFSPLPQHGVRQIMQLIEIAESALSHRSASQAREWDKAFVALTEEVENTYADEYDESDFSPSAREMEIARDYAAGLISEVQEALVKNGLNGFRSAGPATWDEQVKAGCIALCEFEKRPPFATGDFFDCGQAKDEPAWKTKVPRVEAILRGAGDAYAAIRTLRTDRKPATQEGWRDIESAPKDGTYFDVWITPPASHRLKTPHRRADVRYVCEETEHFLVDRFGNTVDYATHHMPLPAPPGSLSRDGGV